MDAWRAADNLRDFQAATQESFAAGDLARALSDERAAAVLARLRPGSAADAAVGAAQRRTDAALQRSRPRGLGLLPVDVAGRLAAIRRQLYAPRPSRRGDRRRCDRGWLRVDRPRRAGPRARPRHRVPPPDGLRPEPADAYVAILAALEPADRERLDVAALLSRRRDRARRGASRYPAGDRQARHLPRDAGSRLATDLAASLFTPAGMRVTDVRSTCSPPRSDRSAQTRPEWLAASRSRIADCGASRAGPRRAGARGRARPRRGSRAPESRARRLAGPAGSGRCAGAGPAAVDHATARRGVRERAGAVRRRPSADVDYVGSDEIGDVAEAFRDLHVTSERLAAEIRAMNAAITRNRLDHRADVAALEGTWSQLLGGMNETMAAFADLQGRRREASARARARVHVSLDLLCIAGFDGYFKRVNLLVRTSATREELLSRPFIELVHPDDRAQTDEAVACWARAKSCGVREPLRLPRRLRALAPWTSRLSQSRVADLRRRA